MAPLEGAILPKGSLILVTGVNGYVGSHVADQFLQHGYKIRGTVRDAKKNAWVASYFDKHYGTGKFELVEIQDLTDLEAIKKALQGKPRTYRDADFIKYTISGSAASSKGGMIYFG